MNIYQVRIVTSKVDQTWEVKAAAAHVALSRVAYQTPGLEQEAKLLVKKTENKISAQRNEEAPRFKRIK